MNKSINTVDLPATGKNTEISKKIHEIRSRLVNQCLLLLAVLVIPTVMLSLLRINTSGWQPIMYLHIFLALLLTAVGFLRQKFSYRVRCGVLFTCLIITGIAGLLTYGLIGGSVVILTITTIASTIIFGLRTGVVFLLMNTLAILITGICVHLGIITYSFDFNIYAMAPESWFLFITGFVLFTGMCVAISGLFNRYLIETLSVANQRKIELLESQKKYQTLFEQSADATVLLDGDTLIDCNAAAANMFGYTNMDEMLGIHPSKLSPLVQSDGRDSFEKANEMISMAFKNGSHHFKWDHIRKNGEVFPVEITLTAITYTEKNYLYAVLRDITERQQAEIALKKRERQLTDSQKVANLGSWDMDLVNQTLEWSEETYRLCDKSPELYTPSFEEFARMVHPDDLETMYKVWNRTVSGSDEPYYLKIRMINDTGRQWVMEAMADVERDKEGKVTRIYGTTQDVTERVEIEKALIASENKYRKSVETMTEFVVHHKPDGVRTFVNSAYCKYFNQSPEQLLGRSFFPLIPEQQRKDIQELIQTLTPGNSTITDQHQAILPDGTLAWHEWVNTGIFDNNGKLVEIQSVGRDISDRKQIELDLANRTKQLLSNQKALVELAKKDFPDQQTAFNQIVKTDAEHLGVARVSIWLFNEDRTAIICKALYHDGETSNEEMTLNADNYPGYFEALETTGFISANDANNDPATCEFSNDYLTPLGITSMMDTPIYLEGEIVGVVCHEHIGPVRGWTVEDEDFASSIADMCAVVLAASKRKLVEIALRKSEEKFSKAFEASTDAVGITRISDGKFIYANPSLVKISKHSLEDIRNKTVLELNIWVNMEDRNNLVQLLKEKGQVNDYKTSLRASDGEIFPVSIAASAIEIEGESYMVSFTRDMTEQKKAEDALQQYQKQLRTLASEVIIAEEQERRRIAIELHDDVIQDLGLSRIKLGELSKRLASDDYIYLVNETRELIERIIKESRSLVFDLSLPVLYELGYEAAIKWLAEQTEKKLNIPCRVHDDGQTKPMGKEMQVLLFKAVRELLINIGKHARANKIHINIQRIDGRIEINVHDDGVGFEPDQIKLAQGKSLKFGLFGIIERLNLLNGTVEINSSLNNGTSITLTAPLESGNQNGPAIN